MVQSAQGEIQTAPRFNVVERFNVVLWTGNNRR